MRNYVNCALSYSYCFPFLPPFPLLDDASAFLLALLRKLPATFEVFVVILWN